MKMRDKGKVYPSPSSSSSASLLSTRDKDCSSVLKLLPAAILTIAAVLSFEDREVLTYMIARSMKATGDPSAFAEEKNNKKHPSEKSTSRHVHKSPRFDCECFNCYTSYWSRWNSSPDRELIHRAMEAFEEHLNSSEESKRCKNKKRDKTGRRAAEKLLESPEAEADNQPPETSKIDAVAGNDVPPPSAELTELVLEKAEDSSSKPTRAGTKTDGDEAKADESAGGNKHGGLARKVLADVLGICNWRLWRVWSTNV